MNAQEALELLVVERDVQSTLTRLFDPEMRASEAVPVLRTLLREAANDLDSMLNEVIECCAQHLDASGGFIHVWDEAEQKLIIRATAQSDRRWLGMFPMSLGEGIVGLCALNAEPIHLTRNPVADPRIFRIKEMGDDIIQTHLIAPAIGPTGGVVGTISVRALRENAFNEAMVEHVLTVAQLVGLAIHHTQVADAEASRGEALRRIAALREDTSSEAAVQRTLHDLAECAGQVLGMTEMFIFSTEADGGTGFTQTGWSLEPRHRAAEIGPAKTAVNDALNVGALSAPIADIILRENGLLAERSSVLLAEPLRIDGRTIGVMLCAGLRHPSETQRDLVTVLASRAANVLERVRGKAARAARDRSAQIMHELAAGKFLPEAIEARADRIGLDLRRPNVVVTCQWLDSGSGEDREPIYVTRAINRMTSAATIAASPGRLVAILPLRKTQSSATIASQLQMELQARSGGQLAVTIGVSEPCATSLDFPEAFRQAQDVLDLAPVNSSRPWARAFGSVAALAHLKVIALSGRTDPQQTALSKLHMYDEAHGTSLYQTLETYLACGGNSKTTADQLTLHRNTLRQRLTRCSEVMNVDITDTEIWFELGLAARIVRLRQGLK